jgi:hypothetical protein
MLTPRCVFALLPSSLPLNSIPQYASNSAPAHSPQFLDPASVIRQARQHDVCAVLSPIALEGLSAAGYRLPQAHVVATEYGVAACGCARDSHEASSAAIPGCPGAARRSVLAGRSVLRSLLWCAGHRWRARRTPSRCTMPCVCPGADAVPSQLRMYSALFRSHTFSCTVLTWRAQLPLLPPHGPLPPPAEAGDVHCDSALGKKQRSVAATSSST